MRDVRADVMAAWFLFNVVLFPTDRFGRRVDDPRCYFRDGAMFVLGGGLFIACDPEAIPWRRSQFRDVPTFEMNIDGWNPAPAGLADFIDRSNKNGGPMPASLAPGQSETNKATSA